MKRDVAKVVKTAGKVMSVATFIAIVTFSLLPAGDVQAMVSLFPLADVGAHTAAYAAFAFFFVLAIHKDVGSASLSYGIGRRLIETAIVLSGAFVLGLALEIAQPLFQRSNEGVDLIADMVGASCGIAVGFLCMYVACWRGRRSAR